jgi:DtxR family Mn-dependent transcriptional regulator
MEDYIKAIYKIQRHATRATTLLIASRLGFSAASVTNMLKKLAELGLVDYTPYQGVELTAAGQRVALEIVRHHRLIELYLTEHMGYSWDEVDAEAETLEHVISEAFESRMDALLGHPTTDPHGDPIPSADGTNHDEPAYMPLSDGHEEQRVTVMRVSDRDPRLLRDLARIGLFPTVELVLLPRLRKGGRVRFRVGDAVHSISAAQAAYVYVHLIPENPV